jgi:hypothetical protein
MQVYKLTDENLQTYKGFQWTLNKTYEVSGQGDLCSAGWLHAYEDPLLAVLHNPIHADYKNPRLFVAEADGEIKRDGQMKLGCQKMILKEKIPLPVISDTQRTAYGILCAKEVCKDPDWNLWADNWLSGKDRSESAARYARSAAWSAAESAVWSAESAVWSAESAQSAAQSAARSAESAQSAARSAAESAESNNKIDLISLAKKAMLEY